MGKVQLQPLESCCERALGGRYEVSLHTRYFRLRQLVWDARQAAAEGLLSGALSGARLKSGCDTSAARRVAKTPVSL